MSERQGTGVREDKRGRRLVAGVLALGALGATIGAPLATAAAASPQTIAVRGGFGGYSWPGSGYSESSSAGSNTGPAASGTSQGYAMVPASQSKGVALINTELPNGSGAGTGMVLSADGLVLTNYHVVEGSTQVRATIADSGRTYTAKVLGHDASKDVAVLQLEDAAGLSTVTLADSPVTAGDRVTAVGNANGQQFLSAAAGRVTDPTSQVTASDAASPTETETLTDVFRTDVAVVSGDSGGPMFNSAGEVVGMTTAGSQSSAGGRYRTTVSLAESYAVPIDRAMAVVRQVQSGQSAGTVRVGANAYLGVLLDASQGTLAVVGVNAGTPAQGAGLQRGDTITSIGDTRVTDSAGLTAALALLTPGTPVRIGWTDASGVERSASLTLGASPAN